MPRINEEVIEEANEESSCGEGCEERIQTEVDMDPKICYDTPAQFLKEITQTLSTQDKGNHIPISNFVPDGIYTCL